MMETNQETNETNKIRIVSPPSKENPFIILYKPHGLPSAPLTENDTNNALSKACELFPEIKNVKGRKEIEKGLFHRLDTVTSGLLLIAVTQDCYDKMSDVQTEGKFYKYYKAKCDVIEKNSSYFEGFPVFQGKNKNLDENDEIIISSFFRPFGNGNREVRPVTADSGKAALKKVGKLVEYETLVKIISIEKNGVHSDFDISKENIKITEKTRCEVLCKINRGYRHQVRCHLAWVGLPVVNDEIYNSNVIEQRRNNIAYPTNEITVFNDSESLTEISSVIEFEACGLEFPHPVTGETIRIGKTS